MGRFLRDFLRNRKAAFGLAIVLFYVLVALAAPLITTHDPNKRVTRPHQPPSIENVMGSTRMGRDVYTQLVWGTRTSLAVGFLAGFIVTAIGTLIGITAGYFGGWVDETLNFLTNIVLIIPQLPLLLVLAGRQKTAGGRVAVHDAPGVEILGALAVVAAGSRRNP